MQSNRIATLCMTACLLTPVLSFAGEGGVSVYQPGFFDSMAGYMPKPGTYGETKLFIYDGEIAETFLGNEVVTRVQSDMVVGMFSITHVTEATFWGAQYGYSVLLPAARVNVDANVQIHGDVIRETDRDTGLGDLALTPVMLGWHRENIHTLFLLDVYLPTGSYDAEDLATTGMNRLALEPMFNITHFNPESGFEASAAMGLVFNSRNDDTDYDSGDEFHLDFTFAKWLDNGWTLGASGYWFRQISGDSGAPEILGTNKGEVFGLGPLLAYSTRLGENTEFQFKAKYYKEFGASNRMEGDALWLNASFSF